ncbi:hypothetical protein [Rhizobium laguerreae]|uniref:hypothetical protein n=1 Tax=Rhizobium laguerreae TaxID=1076926 RepID=UPI0021B10412|nr:hypothetical protein [Rhizobium laguerreae]
MASGIPKRVSERFRVNGLRAACDFATAGGIFRDGLTAAAEDDRTIEIGLPNGRRLTIPASLDPTTLARLLPVLDAS